MARSNVVQNDFSGGELAPELAARTDTQQYNSGLKSATNARFKLGGGASRRPGTWHRAELAGDGIGFPWVVNDETRYVAFFSNGRMDAYTAAGVWSGAVTAAPWSAGGWARMDYAQFGNTAILTHPDFLKIITRNSNGTWTLGDFPWLSSNGGNRINQPHHKLAAPGITMQPSATSGSVTLSLNNSHWQNAHIGKRVRYLHGELEITAVGTPTSATATVYGTLPPSQRLTVGSTATFVAGDATRGATSGIRGMVYNVVNGTTMDVVVTEGLTGYSTETIVGPNGSSAISAVGAPANLAAVTNWTEQLYSSIWGWPRTVELHRGRILLGGSAGLPNAIAGSSLFDPFDFYVGDGSDADGFLETIGDSTATQVVRMHSAEQLIIATNRGPYYVPETPANPFRPTSLAFNTFGGSWPANEVPIGPFDGGIMIGSLSSVIKASPTGNTTQSWSARDVTLLTPHLFEDIRGAAYTTAFCGFPEGYAFYPTDDGSLAVLMLIDDQKIRNVAPWETDGSFRSVIDIGQGQVFVVVRRTMRGGTVYVLEQFDRNLTLDCCTTYSDLSLVPIRYRLTDVKVLVDNPLTDLGAYPLETETPLAGPYTVGIDYSIDWETLPPAIDGAQSPSPGDFMRITHAVVNCYESYPFKTDGYNLRAYADVPIAKSHKQLTGPLKFEFLGAGERAPTLRFTQDKSLPFTVLGLKYEVAW